MIRSDEEKKKMVEINKKMIDKVVKVVDLNDSYWVGKVMDVIDHETFSIRRNKSSDPKNVNMFNVRSM
tara:strand:+ start:421 stop:624 length:204 start_codon:yes stop_codon:yes gene_type:complete